MNKISKEVKIGIGFVIAIFILYFGISYLKGINIFKSANSYTVKFKNVDGLTKSAPITLNGFQVGLVNSIQLDPNDPSDILVQINLDKGVRIPKKSNILLNVSMLGNSSLSLNLNKDSHEFYLPNDTINGDNKKGLTDAVNKMMPSVQSILPKLDSIMTGVNSLLSSDALKQSLQNVETLTANMNKMTLQLNALTSSLNTRVPSILKNLDSISQNVNSLTGKINEMDIKATYKTIDSTMQNLKNLTDKFNSKTGSVGLLLNDRGLYDSINKTMGNASALLKDLKEHPKRYVNIKIF